MTDTQFDLALTRAPTYGGVLFLYTPSAQPCGVEIFTSTLVAALRPDGAETDYDLLPVSGYWRGLPALARRILQAREIVFSLPLVAWKQMLLTPLLLLVFAVVTRRRVAVIMHEWSALHWLRRLILKPFVILSDAMVVLSPLIRDQMAADPWLFSAARKCRLIPHPPTVQRPPGRAITGTVRGIQRAAEDCDIVIGYFGAIYQGKGPDALLDICANLRSRGIRALAVFAGSFTRSLDNYEDQFRARIAELDLEQQVIVTGYIKTTEELYTIFESMDVFLLLYPEGLTARRSSVIACLQSGRPIVVSEPASSHEFRHHAGMTALIEAGALSFVHPSADIAEIADELVAAPSRKVAAAPPLDCAAWWNATTVATRAVL